MEKVHFRCVKCSKNLFFEYSKQNDHLLCSYCGSSFLIKNGVYFFEKNSTNEFVAKEADLLFKLKKFFKRYPRLFYYLAHFFGGIQFNISAKKFVRSLPKDKVIINVGSGERKLGERVISLDLYNFIGVTLVASASNLPLQDNSVDAVVCDSLLEHVQNPGEVMKEINRVLKPGGLVYVGTPFIIGYHSAPGDYFRWTKSGIRQLCKDFKEIEFKVAYGPTSAFVSILSHWLAILFSFNISVLYGVWLIFFMILLSPMQFIDLLISRYKSADNIAMGFYFIGKKTI